MLIIKRRQEALLMYEEYWGFQGLPFQIFPDLKFYYSPKTHEEAIKRIFYAIKCLKGSVLLTGEVGSGKTTVIRVIMDKLLEADFEVGLLNHPTIIDNIEFIKEVLFQFDVKCDVTEKRAMVHLFYEWLVSNYTNRGKHAVLIIDEAHLIKDNNILEELRLLSNSQINNQVLLTLMMVGQSELRKVVHGNRAFEARIGVKYHLMPFNLNDTRAYIEHRLKIVGGEQNIFTEEALIEIQKFSKGLAREINRLCDLSLFQAFLEGKKCINEELVRKIFREESLKAGELDITTDEKLGIIEQQVNGKVEKELEKLVSFEKDLLKEKDYKEKLQKRIEDDKQALEEAQERAIEEARKQAFEEAQRNFEREIQKSKEDAQKKALEEARQHALEDARKRAKEEARRKAEEETLKREEEEARLIAEEETRRKILQEAQEKSAEEAKRKAMEEARKRAIEEAGKKAFEETLRKVEEEARQKALEEATQRAQEEARQKVLEEATQRAQEETKKKALYNSIFVQGNEKILREKGEDFLFIWQKIKKFFQELIKGQKPNPEEIFESAEIIIRSLAGNDELIGTLFITEESNDLVTHLINVAIISTKIGLGLGYGKDELMAIWQQEVTESDFDADYGKNDLKELVVCALLHDMGMMKVPAEILSRKEKLTAEQLKDVRLHPQYSCEMLEAIDGLPSIVAHVAFQEHEREDGSGYPQGLKAEKIHEYAKIIGLADIYVAMLQPRPQRERKLPFEIVKEIIKTEKKHFPAHLIKIIINELSFFPVGLYVTLNTGETGKVKRINKLAPMRPVVDIIKDAHGVNLKSAKEYDLMKEHLLRIENTFFTIKTKSTDKE